MASRSTSRSNSGSAGRRGRKSSAAGRERRPADSVPATTASEPETGPVTEVATEAPVEEQAGRGVLHMQGRAVDQDLDPARCIVLVPVRSHVEAACEEGLNELRARGYYVRQVVGQTAIDYARSKMVSDALAAGYDEIMWIDSDVGFHAEDVEKLRRHRLPVVSAIYPQKGHRSLASHLMPGTREITFGRGGGLLEILYAAGGFLLTHRLVYEAIRLHEKLPVCNERFNNGFTPYFWPMIIPDGEGHWYLAEDFAFCERSRRAGIPVMADTTIRLEHVGSFGYSWEDAGGERERYSTYSFSLV